MPDRPGQTLGQRLLPQRTIRTDVRQVSPRRPAHDLGFLQRLREAGL